MIHCKIEYINPNFFNKEKFFLLGMPGLPDFHWAELFHEIFPGVSG